jgi:hypothetical protein
MPQQDSLSNKHGLTPSNVEHIDHGQDSHHNLQHGIVLMLTKHTGATWRNRVNTYDQPTDARPRICKPHNPWLTQ